MKGSSYFEPLRVALRKIQFGLTSDAASPIMVARHTVEEFLEQPLPVHCEVKKRKLDGLRRVLNEGQNDRTMLADWPNDGLTENIAPVLVFVLSGQADIRVSDYVVSCQSGDCLFIPARMPRLDGSRPHYETISQDAHCDILFVNPNGLYSSFFHLHICHSYGERHEVMREGESCWFVSPAHCALFAVLAEILQSKGASKSTFYLVQSLVELSKQELEIGNALNSREFPSTSPSLHQQSPIEQAVQYTRLNFSRPLVIDQVARWVGLSRSVFVSRFRQETGLSFNAYLTQLRLEHAKVLLSQSQLPINKISDSVGLSVAQFRNMIYAECHCSPSEYRKNHRKG